MSTVEQSYPSRAPALAPVTFTLTIFLSASLLFFVQPLFAKIALPVIGGAPAVWTTAMLFFQSVLIAGYLYAHLSSKYLTVGKQLLLHLLLWAGALTFLPPDIPDGWRLDGEGSVALQTLVLFALGIGAPFALLSANAPLIQNWYRQSGGPSANDPYFLYGASNLGSLMALLAFPLLAEPLFGATSIAIGFSSGFVVLGAGLMACGAFAASKGQEINQGSTKSGEKIGMRTLAWWGLLAFIPSSLMLSVTSKISTDLGALPLVWVIPLALYLLTFVLAFTNKTYFRGTWLSVTAQVSIAIAILLFSGVRGVHLSALDVAALMITFFLITAWAHRTLYEARPRAENLTLFYVTMSVGGALGGLFNSILAPALFNGLYEGMITLIIALVVAFRTKLDLTPKPLILAVAVGAGLCAALYFLTPIISDMNDGIRIAVRVVPTLLILLLFRRNLTAVAVCLGMVAMVPSSVAKDITLFKDRSFFGLHGVFDRGGVRIYKNGTTLHGVQYLTEDGNRPTPSSYYHPNGPMGQIMESELGQSAQDIGVVGLGVGSLACYAKTGQSWHFYEIDAMVDRVARDTDLFTFLHDCAPDSPTYLGDARVVLEEQTDLEFDILVIDAYSSDAVPMHLTTLEAVKMYMDRLTPTGTLVLHISNRYFDLSKPLARIADALGLSIWLQDQSNAVGEDEGFRPSIVAVIAGPQSNAATFMSSDVRWVELMSDGAPVWTDEKANPLSALKDGHLRSLIGWVYGG